MVAGTGALVIEGRYELKREVGRGGMGVVWEAEDTVLRRPVAVKQLQVPAELSPVDERTLRERFLREARSAAALDHPAIISVYDVSQEADDAWMVMQLVRGRSLHSVIQEDGPLPVAEAARIGLVLLDALDCAHGEGIVHRDVKPGNVLVSEQGRVVLTDFGIAVVRDATAVTRTGVVIGTPGFIAPERATGRLAGPASDLWALGATLCVAVEGRLIHEEPLRRAGALEPVIKGLLTDAPVGRWTSVRARRHLRAAAGQVEPPPTTRFATGTARQRAASEAPQDLPGASGTPPRWSRRSPLIALLAGAVAGAVVAGLTVTLASTNGTGGEPPDDGAQVSKAKPAVVPDLCEALERHPRMDAWVPNARSLPAADRLPSNLHCGYFGTEEDGDENELKVTVVGYADEKAARAGFRHQTKDYENRGYDGQLPGDTLSDEDGYQAFTVSFRVGPYLAKVYYEKQRGISKPKANEVAVWVADQLRVAVTP